MKKWISKNDVSIRILIIGLVLVLTNCVLDLGVLQTSNSLPKVAYWIFSFFSKCLSAIGIAMIIGYVTDYIKGWIRSKQFKSNNAEELLLEDINSLRDTFDSYQKMNDYIVFVESLFDNNFHNFNLLPRIRMYLHKHNAINKIHIKRLDIECEIFAPTSKTSDKSTSKITNKFYISQNTIIDTYNFITGNDFTTKKPKIVFSYGSSKEQSINMNSVVPSPIRDNPIRTIPLTINHSHISSYSATWEMTIKSEYVRLFDFDKNNEDIIICLPKAFGERVDLINYTIKFLEFDNNKHFSCNLNKCTIVDGEYTVTQEGCDLLPSSSSSNAIIYKKTIQPEINENESAYYFVITAETK